MKKQIQELICQDSQLQQQLNTVVTLTEAAELIVASGIKQGYQFITSQVTEVLNNMQMLAYPEELSEEELLGVAGGLREIPMAEERRK
jgi:hypothetical protein